MEQVTKHNNETQELLQLVSFNIGVEEFGVDILRVNEIIKFIDITHLPNSPEFVEGIINLRGKVIPVIDLRIRMHFPKRKPDNSTRIMVVEVGGKTVGFIVDSVSEVLRISKDIFEAPPEIVAGINAEYISAVGKLENRILILLDLEKVLSNEEDKQLASMN
jgi:purine-binding chemotaxis protein CheW